jgi:hypothetical protein
MSDRMIIRDPRGRVVSVPADSIPKGSTILRPDVLPGQSANTMDVNVSEVKNPEKEPKAEVVDDDTPSQPEDEADTADEPEKKRKRS